MKYGETFYGCHTALETCCCDVLKISLEALKQGKKANKKKHEHFRLGLIKSVHEEQ
jgi:hypothetical protein